MIYHYQREQCLSMSNQDIIEKLAKDRTIETIISNIAKTNDESLNDLSQDLYIALLEKDNELINYLWDNNQMKFFITRMALNNIYSETSPYYKTYKKFQNKSEEINMND